MAISCIVIGYNSLNYLHGCFRSIQSQVLPIDETIFVDNNSDDDSVNFVEDNFHFVNVMKNRENLGFSRAVNRGIDQSTGDFILIMNPDVVLAREFVSSASCALSLNQNAAAVTGLTYKFDPENPQNAGTIDSAGLLATRGRRFLDRGAGETHHGQYAVQSEVFGVSCHSALFRRSALADAKVLDEYFDENFFMYKEDVDLCWRLRLLGWSFIYEPRAVSYHVRGTGVINRSRLLGAIQGRIALTQFQRYHSYVNHRMMLVKNEIPRLFFRDAPFIVANEIANFLWVAVFEPKSFLGLRSVAKKMKDILRKRRVIMVRASSRSESVSSWLISKGSQAIDG